MDETELRAQLETHHQGCFAWALLCTRDASSQAEDVLTVPVGALLALAEGGYGLEIIEGSTSRIIAVQTGLFADGQVEVTGQGLDEGTTVGMPS